MALPRGAVILSACVIVVLTMLTYFLETSLNAVVHYSFAKYIYLYIFFFLFYFFFSLDKYVLKRESFGSKDCTKELKLECAYFLGQTS